jgi:hypothetical protein
MRRLFPLVVLLGLAGPAFADTPGVSGELEQSSSTTPRQKAEFADGAVDEIQVAVRTVEGLLADAQKEKNTEQIECLTRKLTPMRELSEVSQTSSNSMKAALASNDAVHADQEFRQVAVALTKTREFLAEAQACVGEAGVKRGSSSATVTDNGVSLVQEGDVAIDETPPDDWGSQR